MADGVDRLIEINKMHSELFCGEHDDRVYHRSLHKTEIVVLQCMDGRVNFPIITKTPLGIIRSVQSLGGKFDLGWPHFGNLVKDFVRYSLENGKRCVFLVTYHFARHDNSRRGCRGFEYDVSAAREFTKKLCTKFGELHPAKSVVHALQWGIDTDTDALILHGDNGEVIDLAQLNSETPVSTLHSMLQQRLYSDMDEKIIYDLLPLIEKNLIHISEVCGCDRNIQDLEHNEWVLGVGDDFDWLHMPNTALIVGQFSPDLSVSIVTAAEIILGNIKAGRISQKKPIVLLASASYRNSTDKLYMLEQARFLTSFSLEKIKEFVPKLLGQIQTLTVTVNMHTRLFDTIERGSA